MLDFRYVNKRYFFKFLLCILLRDVMWGRLGRVFKYYDLFLIVECFFIFLYLFVKKI